MALLRQLPKGNRSSFVESVLRKTLYTQLLWRIEPDDPDTAATIPVCTEILES
jgi:hypothetical protein